MMMNTVLLKFIEFNPVLRLLAVADRKTCLKTIFVRNYLKKIRPTHTTHYRYINALTASSIYRINNSTTAKYF